MPGEVVPPAGGPWRPLGRIVALEVPRHARAVARAGGPPWTGEAPGPLPRPLVLELAAQLGGMLAQASWLHLEGAWRYPFLLVADCAWTADVAIGAATTVEADVALVAPAQCRVRATVRAHGGSCLAAQIVFTTLEIPERAETRLRRAAKAEWRRLGWPLGE